MSKFNKGQKVKVIWYGEIVLSLGGCVGCGKEQIYKDAQPEVIGKIGIIDEVETAHGLPVYSLSGIPEKARWFNEEQLKLV